MNDRRTAEKVRDGLRTLANVDTAVLFILTFYFGATFAWGGSHRFSPTTWVYVWQAPHAALTWGLPPIAGAVLGLLALVFKKWHIVALVCGILSFWAFLLGCFLLIDVTTDPYANLWWPPVLWFVSFCYTMRALSMTDRYL